MSKEGEGDSSVKAKPVKKGKASQPKTPKGSKKRKVADEKSDDSTLETEVSEGDQPAEDLQKQTAMETDD